MRPSTIGALVRAQARDTPDAPATIHGGERRSWNELDADGDHWAALLVASGVASGDRIAIVGLSEPRFLRTFIGAARIGAVFVGLNPKYRPDELRHVLDDSAPTLLLDPAGLLDGIEVGVPRLSGPAFAAALAAAPPVPADRLDTVDPGAPAAIVYTSGSTGRPKGALLSHAALVRTAEVQARYWLTTTPPTMLCNLPINHVGAVGNICCTALVTGGCLVFQERFDAGDVLDLIERERIDHWGAVPTMLQLSVAHERWPTTDLSSLRAIVWSGGMAPVNLVRELRSRCGTLRMSYGSTETVGEVCFADPDADDAVLAETIGRPAAEYEVQLVDAEGRPCAPGAAGEIVVRGVCQALGYWNAPEATAELLDADGWLHTGDLAVARLDGNLQLVGRTREMYKSGGYNVYPREVELAIERHPAVVTAAVVSVPDELYGEVGHAWVQAPAGKLDDGELREHLSGLLANYKLPKRITIVEALPLLPIGKVDKRALAARSTAAVNPETGHQG
ncbi:AMP-binding protein [Nonomuraea sp. NPDC046570]|uniref:class I adenylate-forming enzyme family protein n=1 Tax=Nonomuraea sp. NPDC046570 TaxID=3155255 RepID=UPI0033CAC926